MLISCSVIYVIAALPSCLGMWGRLTDSSSSSSSGRRARQQQPPPPQLPPVEMSADHSFANEGFGAIDIPLGDADENANLLYPEIQLDRNMYTQVYDGYPLPPGHSMHGGIGSTSFNTDTNSDTSFQPYQQPLQSDESPYQYSSYHQPYDAYTSYNQPSFHEPHNPYQEFSYFPGASSATPYSMPPAITDEDYEGSGSAGQTTQALDRLNLGDAPPALQRVRTRGSSRVVSGGYEIGSSGSGSLTSRSHRDVSRNAEMQQEEQRQMPHTARVRRPSRTDTAPSARTMAKRAREAKRAWLINQWQERGMNTETMAAQELAQEVTLLKIHHPDNSATIGIMSAQFVEEERGAATCAEGLPFNLDNEEYVYDYTTWMSTYTQKLSKTKEYYGGSMPAEELRDLLLRTFRSARPKHHATLADPDKEREQQMIAMNVWNDFMEQSLHQYLSHSGLITAQDIPIIAEAGRHYRYISMDHKDSQRYIRKYLAKMARWRPCEISHLEALQKHTLPGGGD